MTVVIQTVDTSEHSVRGEKKSTPKIAQKG
jgi:hypothetical protein